MKNIIIFILVLLLLLIFFGLNAEFGWFTFQWKYAAIGASALAGPFQYMKNLMDQKQEEKEMEERRYKYRVLEHEEFMAREKNNLQKPSENTVSQNVEKDTFLNQAAVG